MDLLAYKLSNANVYLNGVDLLGRAEEVDFPQIKHKTVEHKGLGMAGSPEFWVGIDKLECRITWNSIFTDITAGVFGAMNPQQLMIRGYQQQISGGGLVTELPVVGLVTGIFKESPKISVSRCMSRSPANRSWP